MIIEADATLADPYFAAGFAAATFISVVLAIAAVRAWKRTSPTRRLLPVCLFACLGVSLLATPAVMHAVPRWLHRTFGSGAQVCYWSTGRYHIASFALTGIVLLASVVAIRRRIDTSPSKLPEADGRT